MEMTKGQAIAQAIEQEGKELTTLQIVSLLRVKYSDQYIKDEVIPHCTKGIRMALEEIIK